MMKYISVAIDGPSGAGKSTVARAAAAKLGYVYVDTGAMYRSIGLAVCRKGIAGEDTAGIIATLPEITIQLTYQDGAQRVLLNGEDVSEAIRTPEISYYASKVSAVPEVRKFLLETQRNMAKNGNILMDGRDIGTVILPDAPVKIFLTASAQSRAERREFHAFSSVFSRIIRRTAAMLSSSVRLLVSSRTASSACLSGATARVMSCLSRSLISCRMPSIVTC